MTTALALGVTLVAAAAYAQPTTPIGYRDALERARRASPDVAAVRAEEAVARAGVGVAGTYPNPSWAVGTNSQTAVVSGDVSIPLVVLGQIGTAKDAARGDLDVARMDTRVAWADVRAQAAHAFVALWLADKVAAERRTASGIEQRLERAVNDRVDVGAAPQIDALRVHAERLRADAEADEASALVVAAAAELGRWIGMDDGSSLRPAGDPDVPSPAPSLGAMRARVGASPAVRRAHAEAAAALARASHERALARPTLSLDLGIDLFDPTLPDTNYRAQLGFDFPIFNYRGSYVDREENAAAAARSREAAERIALLAALTASYARFAAIGRRADVLATGVVPAAEAAARATEDAYGLGRASLVAVLDAEKARLDARVSLEQARAERADAWVEVEHAAGVAP